MTESGANELVVAVFNRVGAGTNLKDDFFLARAFNEAANKFPSIFGKFAWHRQYKDSKELSSSLQALDFGGAIFRENASGMNIRLSDRVVGEYGNRVFEALDADAKRAVEFLAESIKKIG